MLDLQLTRHRQSLLTALFRPLTGSKVISVVFENITPLSLCRNRASIYLFLKRACMHTKSDPVCFYFKEKPSNEAECMIAEGLIKDIRGADINVCTNKHFNACPHYRGFNEDLIEV